MCGGRCDRGQSEVIATVLMVGLVVTAVSTFGGIYLLTQAEEADNIDQPADFTVQVEQTELTVIHNGGVTRALTDLNVVIWESDNTKTEYDLSDSAIRTDSTLNGNGEFEPGETVTIRHNQTGKVRILIIDTSRDGAVLYDDTDTVP